jgi:ATP-dependent protease HslVU (ClpYQ) peptidase subunit
MSCIAGVVHKNSVYLGCDSIGSDGDCQIARQDSKIFRLQGRPDVLLAFAGSFRAGQLLNYCNLIPPKMVINHKNLVTKIIPKIISVFEKGGVLKADEGGEKRGDQFLLAHQNKLFEIDCDFQVGESRCGYQAIGSGYAYALGSLFTTRELSVPPQERIYMALKSASVFGVGIGPPFRVWKTGSKQEWAYEDGPS